MSSLTTCQMQSRDSYACRRQYLRASNTVLVFLLLCKHVLFATDPTTCLVVHTLHKHAFCCHIKAMATCRPLVIAKCFLFFRQHLLRRGARMSAPVTCTDARWCWALLAGEPLLQCKAVNLTVAVA